MTRHGNASVCQGLRYLLPSITYRIIVTTLSYSRWPRRVLTTWCVTCAVLLGLRLDKRWDRQTDRRTPYRCITLAAIDVVSSVKHTLSSPRDQVGVAMVSWKKVEFEVMSWRWKLFGNKEYWIVGGVYTINAGRSLRLGGDMTIAQRQSGPEDHWYVGLMTVLSRIRPS